jgi:hypothetical protein
MRAGHRSGAEPWWDTPNTFEFGGTVLKLFVGNHNCGWPPARMTERAVELALADRWLEAAEIARVVEIGAVTPYYWPRRVPCIVDPRDPHPLVTTKASLFDVDFSGAPVLSISTLEHVGLSDYGLPVDHSLAVKALRKVFQESPAFLITVPAGYNQALDEFFFEHGRVPDDIVVRHLVRSARGNDWREEPDPAKARLPYPTIAKEKRSAWWANSVIVVNRGNLL